MFLYESKKPAASIKTASSNKCADSGRRVHFDSSACQNNRQEYNFIIQKCPIPTAIAPKSGFAAGSPRPPSYNVSPDSLDDLDFIEYVLSNDDLKKRIESGSEKRFRTRVEIIRGRWRVFLPRFLTHCGFKSFGANQSLTFHRPGRNMATYSPQHRDRGKLSKLNRMYKGSSGIRARRRYTKEEEIKRYLRHCAAAFKLSYNLGSEIQCYYDDEEQIVYVAVNTQRDERKISKIGGEKLSECLENTQRSLRKTNDVSAFRGKAKSNTARLSDRITKPLFRRLKHNLTCPAALRKAIFKIIKSSEVNFKIPGLHAERKILYYLRSQKGNDNISLDPLRLGGIRRPCFVCSALCFKDMSQVHSGPCWVSIAASTPKDVKEMFLILGAIRNNENITHVSDNNGQNTMDNDTDSSEGSECDQDTNR